MIIESKKVIKQMQVTRVNNTVCSFVNHEVNSWY